MRILDPSCGSGIFLVVFYRHLVEKAIHERGTFPAPEELKHLLIESVYGVERDLEACFVAEFSLLLTLLSYINPPQLEKQNGFLFPDLHERNIFHCDFFDPDSSFTKAGLKFDWVVGNPPWSELEPKDEDSTLAIKYIADIQKENCIINRFRVHEAFAWRSREFVKTSGWIGLILQATSLTNEQSERFRQAFFGRNEVRKITNFSNFTYRLFSTSEAPAFTVTFRPSTDNSNPSIVHYGPFVADQLPLQSLTNKQGTPTISIFETDIRTVDPHQAASGEATVWKRALWASYRDEKAIFELKSLFGASIDHFRRTRGWQLGLGLQLRDNDSSEAIQRLSILQDMKVLDVDRFRKLPSHFEITSSHLDAIPGHRQNVRKGRVSGLKVCRAPHAFLTNTFAAYSDLDFVLPHPHVGLSVPAEDANYLRAVCLLLESSVLRFLLFFDSPSWGIFTSAIGLQPFGRLPLPKLTRSQTTQLANLHLKLAGRQAPQGQLFDLDEAAAEILPSVDSSIQEEIDRVVAHVLQLPKHLTVIPRDFMQLRFQLNKGKQPRSAYKQASSEELVRYGHVLVSELDEFANMRHQVVLTPTDKYVLCAISLYNQRNKDMTHVVVQNGTNRDQDFLWKALAEQPSQWLYVQKSLRIVSSDSVILVKPNRRMDWSQSRAYLDSDDVIADLINEATLD